MRRNEASYIYGRSIDSRNNSRRDDGHGWFERREIEREHHQRSVGYCEEKRSQRWARIKIGINHEECEHDGVERTVGGGKKRFYQSWYMHTGEVSGGLTPS
jgi:hypothetical protein